MKKKVNMLVCSLMLSGALALPHTTAFAQSDDITGIKLETEMRAAIEQGILNGTAPGVYEPNVNVTRGQFATFITRALKLPDGPPVFNDVNVNSKLAKGIYSATAVGIINGYSATKFGPNDQITREQAAAMVDNAFKYLQIQRADATANFSDVTEINSGFKMAVAKNAKDEIINGFPNADGTFRFAPKEPATRAHAAAFINRMLIKIKEAPPSTENPETDKPETNQPGTGAKGYQIASIGTDGALSYQATPFDSFDSAKNAIKNTNTQVVTLDQKIVKMASGLVYSKPDVGRALTLIYSDAGLKNNVTYVTGQQEMKYLDATENYVKVNVAGMTAYVKQTEVTLVPLSMAKGRNYYSTNNARDLIHSIYNPLTNSSVSYSMGLAPSFFVPGEKYYSWDGAEFADAGGKVLGKEKQYFNYLPARTKTNYTAEELDQYINYILAEKQGLYTSNPTTFARYKDATTKSKIVGLGAVVKEAEAKHKINALLILAMAMHESDFGMSKYAQDRNNLFGIKAYDSNEDAAENFISPMACIDALANRYLNKNYINPQGGFFNGGVTGNKSLGFNMKYASDPYWGQKISGHMYRADKYLGVKDFGTYRIGTTNTASLNVRTTPDSVDKSNLLFTYKNSGNPVAIIDSVTQPDGSIWYKVLSDSHTYDEAYIYSPFVDELIVAK
ncbi:S-layer homology domain-containing protein [Bacillus sp. CGMCC 1.16607]|uniref:S-layer homology domain-containing protein n=1 Tax=Bacillus sp. CGMCC 1.16607 TaxID=3351842 RepID=UPI003624E17C